MLKAEWADESERESVIRYLYLLYAGGFTEEAIGSHLDNHVGFAVAGYTVEVLRMHSPPGAKVLDVGAGFGSCVIAARDAGFDARGIEAAAFEVQFARRRLQRLRPDDDPEKVFTLGDATRMQLENESLEAVTFWNVLEHVPDVRSLIATAHRLLCAGGLMFMICPNYNAWRLEAHYHVPWRPALRKDRGRAAAYLRSLGRNPRYFETSIFCHTNWEILGLLIGLRYELCEIGDKTPLSLTPRNIAALLRSPGRLIRFYNPHKESVTLVARKPARAY